MPRELLLLRHTPSPEQRPVVPANTDRFSAQELEESIELSERRLLGGSDEGVGQRDQQLPGTVAVDIGVGSPEIAQCLLNPVRARLQEEPLMSGTPAGGGNSEANFKGMLNRGAPRDNWTRLRSWKE